MMDLREVDIESPENDHLGDYRPEHGDPYPSTREAWARQTETLPGETHRDPGEVRQDFARYGASPFAIGTPARIITPSSWAPNGVILTDGVNRFRVAERDPQRARVTVTNYATDPVYLSPTTAAGPGYGACYLPSGATLELRTTGEVWLSTPTGFTAGSADVHLQVVSERYD